MAEEVNIKEVVEEIRASDEESLKKVIEEWFERTRTQGLKIGAQYISAAIFGAIQKNIVKKERPSLRDYKRCIDEIIAFLTFDDGPTKIATKKILDILKENNTNEETINGQESSI